LEALTFFSAIGQWIALRSAGLQSELIIACRNSGAARSYYTTRLRLSFLLPLALSSASLLHAITARRPVRDVTHGLTRARVKGRERTRSTSHRNLDLDDLNKYFSNAAALRGAACAPARALAAHLDRFAARDKRTRIPDERDIIIRSQ